MAHESLINSGWQGAVDRLGGPDQLEEEARALGAFLRARGVKCAVDLLRLTLAYSLGSMGLRLTAAWAEAVGLASLSNVVLLKRLRKMLPWLEILVARLLSADGDGGCAAAAKGRMIRLVDATVVAKAGRADREAGGVWRVHAVFDLPSERFSTFELTGERFDRAAVIPGEIRIGDRAYLQPDRMAAVLDQRADIVVRTKWSGARWLDADGSRVDRSYVATSTSRISRCVNDLPILPLLGRRGCYGESTCCWRVAEETRGDIWTDHRPGGRTSSVACRYEACGCHAAAVCTQPKLEQASRPPVLAAPRGRFAAGSVCCAMRTSL